MANGLHESQSAVHTATRNALRGSGLSDMAEYNAPGASNLSSGVGGLNIKEFDCVVDGMSCQKAGSTEVRITER